MAKILHFPMHRLPREYVLSRAVELARQPHELIETAAVDGDIRFCVGDCEMWFSAEEFAELLEQWSETLEDACELHQSR
jgi:hypothetical protein